MCHNEIREELTFKHETEYYSKKLRVFIEEYEGRIFIEFYIFSDIDNSYRSFILLEEEFEEMLRVYRRIKRDKK